MFRLSTRSWFWAGFVTAWDPYIATPQVGAKPIGGGGMLLVETY